LNNPQAVYIHIPFCAVRCPYCDFNTYAGLEALQAPYMAALCEEIRRAGAVYGGLPVQTIFIGGGTPTVVDPALLAGVLDTCRQTFAVAEDAEITSEANPGTVDQARFAALRSMGVNRLSMGVQSFDDAELGWLGRIHSADEAVAAFDAARAAGFDNINLDFIFGLPHQTPTAWERTIARACALGPEHLSLYSLMVEEGTPLAGWVRSGRTDAPDDDLAADLYTMAQERMGAAGYVQYEISNWARPRPAADIALVDSLAPGFDPHRGLYACRHNLVYWHDEPYLAFGAGAHGYAPAPGGERRWWNVRPVAEYIGRITGGKPATSGDEMIDPRTAMGELMMVGLRLILEGVTDARFHARFGVSLDEMFGRELARLSARGLIERLPDRVRLTPQGCLLGNQVFASFLPDAA
jgi:oxygen-independent coproporphyrinogen III oxidase